MQLRSAIDSPRRVFVTSSYQEPQTTPYHTMDEIELWAHRMMPSYPPSTSLCPCVRGTKAKPRTPHEVDGCTGCQVLL